MNHRARISVILPVYQEAEIIHAAIAHVRSLDESDGLELIIVDGDPGRSTIATIRDPEVITAVSAKGRARQMNRGAELASGDILLFLHADTLLPRDAPQRVRTLMDTTQCMAGAFDLGINSGRLLFRITEFYVALRTRLTRIPFGDQAIFVDRNYFEKIGRFSDIPIMEDIELMKRIRRQGGRTAIVPEKVMTSPRRWEREGVIFCTVRNWMLQILYSCGVSPDRLVKFYRS